MIVTLKLIEAAFGSLEKWLALCHGPYSDEKYADEYDAHGFTMTACALCDHTLDMEDTIGGFSDKEWFKNKHGVMSCNKTHCGYCPISELTADDNCNGTPFELVVGYNISSLEEEDINELVLYYKDSIRQSDDITPDEMRDIIREVFEAEYNLITELVLHLIDCYNTETPFFKETAPQSLKDSLDFSRLVEKYNQLEARKNDD